MYLELVTILLCEKEGQDYPAANIRRWPNAGLLLGQRLRRWANSEPALGQRLIFAGNIPDTLASRDRYALDKNKRDGHH